MSAFWKVLLCVAVGWILLRFIIPRCQLYVYRRVADRRIAVPVGYVQPDGTVYDSRSSFLRRSGWIGVQDDGNAWLRVFHPEGGDDASEDAGYVTAEGVIHAPDGSEVGRVDPEGRRKWFELWLRRHAIVPFGAEDGEEVGRCIETGRFRFLRQDEVGLIARGGAALLLYFTAESKAKAEVPRFAPNAMWDTSLPAGLVFSLLFLISPVRDYLRAQSPVLGFLGPAWSLVATGVALFFSTWIVLHIGKVISLSKGPGVFDYLEAINRQTGIRNWTMYGCIASLLGILLGLLSGRLFEYLPLFIACFIGFFLNFNHANGEPWPVAGGSRTEGGAPRS